MLKDKGKDKKSFENNTEYLEQSNANMKKQISDNENELMIIKSKLKTPLLKWIALT